MIFLQRVLSLASEMNITKNKLLTDIGLNKNSFVDWEKRGTVPGGDAVIKIADYFHVSTDYLLGRTDDPRLVEEVKEPAPVSVDRLFHPPEYEFLTPVNRGIADRLIADLVKSQSSNVTPLQISAIAQGGGEYDTEADTAIILPKDSTKVRPVQDTAGTDGTPSAPEEM